MSFASRVDSSSAIGRPSFGTGICPYVPILRLFYRSTHSAILGAAVPDSSPAVHENKKDPMEVEDAIEALNVALRLQQRSVIAYTHMAGTLVGFQFHGLAAEMASFARAELDDARHLVEKITTLGGDATIEIAPIERADDPEALVRWLIDAEPETTE